MGAFYQSEIVKIIPASNPTGEVIPNVQSVSTAFQITRRESTRLGRFAPTPYRQAENDPLINVNIDFIPTGTSVFRTLGLMGTGSMIDELVSGTKKYNDLKVQIREMVGGGSSVGTINLTSGAITNYSFQASVGQTPKSSISLEFTDMSMDATTAVVPPSIDDGYPTLRAQDIDLTLPTGLFGVNSIFPQSFTFTLPLSRNQINRIGLRKPVSREIASPVIASFSIQAIVDTFASTVASGAGSMFSLTCGAPINGNIGILVKVPTCTGLSTQTMMNYTMRKPYLDNVTYSNSVGGYTSVELQFSCPVTHENNLAESNVILG